MMHSYRVGGASSTFWTGAAVDEIMKIGAWKTESIAEYKIGATSSGQEGSKKKRCQSYSDSSELSLPPRVREMIEAMLRKLWVRQLSTGPVVNYKYNSTEKRNMGGTTAWRRNLIQIQYLH